LQLNGSLAVPSNAAQLVIHMLPHNVLQAERIDSKENTGFADSVRKVRALEAGDTFQSALFTWVHSLNQISREGGEQNATECLSQVVPGASFCGCNVCIILRLQRLFSGCHLTCTCEVDLVVAALWIASARMVRFSTENWRTLMLAFRAGC
jgi:hypothetical protein